MFDEKEYHKKYMREYRKRAYVRKSENKYMRKYASLHKEKCYRYIKKYRLSHPWINTLRSIKRRCNSPSQDAYRWYGAKGIKCLITKEELKILWFRDNAAFMKKPSIDRIDPKSHYSFDNCRYLECQDNLVRRWE